MNPKSRENDLVIQKLNDDLLIYDLKINKIYSLNPTSAFIWNNLDGESSISDLARKIGKQYNQPIDEDLIWLAIDELKTCNLLEESTAPEAMSKLKRREVIKRIGLASMITLPVISSLVAPSVSNAASVSCIPVSTACYGAGTIGCPVGCTSTISIITYTSIDGTCAAPAFPTTINCSDPTQQGNPASSDFRRTA